MGGKKVAAGYDSLPTVRKLGKKSKIAKTVLCVTCGTACASYDALKKHNMSDQTLSKGVLT